MHEPCLEALCAFCTFLTCGSRLNPQPSATGDEGEAPPPPVLSLPNAEVKGLLIKWRPEARAIQVSDSFLQLFPLLLSLPDDTTKTKDGELSLLVACALARLDVMI